MPRRGRAASPVASRPPPRHAAPPPPPPPPRPAPSQVPAHAPAHASQPMMAQAQPQQPSLFKQVICHDFLSRRLNMSFGNRILPF